MAGKVEEVLIAPVAAMIEEIGDSVASASVAMNQAQIEMARNQPKDLTEIGILPTFYHMQDVEVTLKIALHMEGSETAARKWRLFGAPMNAKYKSALKYDVEGSSELKMTFAPGPSPLAVESEE